MSPRRHGSPRSVPSGPRRDTGQPSRERGARRRAATSAASRSRSSSASALVVVGLDAEQHARPGRPRRARAIGLERDVLGLRLGLGDDQLAEHVVDPRRSPARAVRKLRVR